MSHSLKYPSPRWAAIAVLVFACIELQASGSSASPAADIEDLVHSIYSHYSRNGLGIFLGDTQASNILTPTLNGLVHSDIQLLHGEAGILDADPLCGCQDFDIEKVDGIEILIGHSGTHATAKVSFRNFGKSETIDLQLKDTSNGWRIDDISYAGMPSLKKSLEQEVIELNRGSR